MNAMTALETAAAVLPGAPTVYLAGPIAGLNYAGATEWRDDAIAQLAAAGIKGLSPMRAKNYLKDVQEFSKNCHAEGAVNVLSQPSSIMTRDRFDATRCDVILVNFLGAEKVSIGTVMELAWADLSRIPIVCVMEPGNIHEHGMVTEAIGIRVTTLEEALEVVKAILV
jgi:nucleoside 2-deoxyribosyltransferase